MYPFKTENSGHLLFNFASAKENEVGAMPWDLVVIDEAHRLRNVYKPSNVMGKKLKEPLQARGSSS